MKSDCYRCENKSFTFCSKCVDGSNFYSQVTKEEWKKLRKEKTRNEKCGKGKIDTAD